MSRMEPDPLQEDTAASEAQKDTAAPKDRASGTAMTPAGQSREDAAEDAAAPKDSAPEQVGAVAESWDWIKSHRFSLLLAFGALLIYVFSLVYQACEPGTKAHYWVWAMQTVSWQSEEALLSIAYPRELRLESPGEARPLSVWLQRASSTPGPSPTPTFTLTPFPTPSGALTLTLTPTATSTPRPWIVAFSPPDRGILFTDEEGAPVAPQVALTPGAESAAPAVLYLQRAPLATGMPSLALTVSVYGPDGVTVVDTLPGLDVTLESKGRAWRRRFWGLLLGPATPLLMLAGALLAFAQKEWQRRLEQEREERKQAILLQVQALAGLKSRPEEAVGRYRTLKKRTETEPEWQSPDIVQRLEKAFQEAVAVDDLIELAGRWFGESEDDRVRDVARLIQDRDERRGEMQALLQVLEYALQKEPLSAKKAKDLAKALRQIQDAFGGAAQARAARLWVELGRRQGWGQKRIQAFEVPPERLHWLGVWTAPQPEESVLVAAWCKNAGLTFNPFGPETAELDPRLPKYGLRAVFDGARGRKPVLLWGAPGSGKTAAALLLAWDCLNPIEKPHEERAFPVYYLFPATIFENDGQVHLLAAVQATAKAVACYLARRGEGFFNLSPPRRQSVALLLSLWASSAGHLKAELRRVGPEWGTSRRLVREVTALYQPISPAEMSEQDCLDLLATARPSGFECTYLLADWPGSGTGAYARMDTGEPRPWLDLMVPLAARGVYLKLFLPDELSVLAIPPACATVDLIWTPEGLAKMLQDRIRAAGGESLIALCGPDVPRDPSPDARLVRAADGSPRQLVRLGNRLIEWHARQGLPASLFPTEGLDCVLGPLPGRGAL